MPVTNGVISETVGSSGTLVGAVLESFGYYYQDYILRTLGGQLSTSVAFFIYTAVALAALVQFVVSGKGQSLMWMLIGPGLFLWVMGNTTNATISEWRFGNQVRNNEQVVLELRNSIGNDPGRPFSQAVLGDGAEVSSLFAGFNRFSSQIVSDLVAMINSARQNIDFKFITRAEIFGHMHAVGAGDYRFQAFLHGALFRQCSDMLQGARQLSDIYAMPNRRSEGEALFNRARFESRANLSEPAREWLTALSVMHPQLYSVAETGTPEMVLDRALALQWFEPRPANATGVPPWGSSMNSDEWNRSYGAQRSLVHRQLSCQQVWNYAYAGLLLVAKQQEQQILSLGERRGVPRADMVEDLVKAKGGQIVTPPGTTPTAAAQASSLLNLNRVIASYILRNEMERGNVSSFIQEYSGKGFENTQIRGMSESDLSVIERTRTRTIEDQERTKYVTTATSLPYYQGLILFFLSIAFPFFALLLLIPGRYMGFLTWFFLWFWAKSWDVGFAVVMLLDDILYSIFATGEQVGVAATGQQGVPIGVDPSFTGTIAALQTLDPTFNLGTYYTIIGAAMAAVPMITSYLILGSLKGGAGLVQGAVSDLSDALGGRAIANVTGAGIRALRVGNLQSEFNQVSGEIERAMGGGEQSSSGGTSPVWYRTMSMNDFPSNAQRSGELFNEAERAREDLGVIDGTLAGAGSKGVFGSGLLDLKAFGLSARIGTDALLGNLEGQATLAKPEYLARFMGGTSLGKAELNVLAAEGKDRFQQNSPVQLQMSATGRNFMVPQNSNRIDVRTERMEADREARAVKAAIDLAQVSGAANVIRAIADPKNSLSKRAGNLAALVGDDVTAARQSENPLETFAGKVKSRLGLGREDADDRKELGSPLSVGGRTRRSEEERTGARREVRKEGWAKFSPDSMLGGESVKTSDFLARGASRKSPHKGVDYGARRGTPVFAPRGGQILWSGFSPTAGEWMILDAEDPELEADGYDVFYTFMHFDSGSRMFRSGDEVEEGDLLAAVGNTGTSRGLDGSSGDDRGHHLHFQVNVRDQNGNIFAVDPEEYMRNGTLVNLQRSDSDAGTAAIINAKLKSSNKVRPGSRAQAGTNAERALGAIKKNTERIARDKK